VRLGQGKGKSKGPPQHQAGSLHAARGIIGVFLSFFGLKAGRVRG
jgi:hypothetical protein